MVEKGNVFYKIPIVVIGAGQAGLSAAYYLKRAGLLPGKDFVVLDDEVSAGGAWQHRWDTLTLTTVNGIHDLPGYAFAEAVPSAGTDLQANKAVPAYYKFYEEHFNLQVMRPVKVKMVYEKRERFIVETDGVQFSARGIINASGTWKTPNCPRYPGWELFKGLQLHTVEYNNARDFKNQHVIVVGGGISAVQLLEEIAEVTTTTWVTRRPPDFRNYKFTEEKGREAVAMVEDLVRKGLPPKSVVSVTGLPLTPAIEHMINSGNLDRKPMFQEITATGVRWEDGTEMKADVIFWNTGFRHNLKHLSPLELLNQHGGITMSGKLATRVEKDHRIHLIGYGPSASTIGSNRAGRVAVRELLDTLGLKD
ncbi:MAG TPA: NAD(P)-binding domain-containing protein [Candidatus Sphingobacterium stercoripullorum]|nr:NAD(P)-binding domain-containing protein [Candidatus Sphingobacterium stercoripullorum]